MLFPEEDSPALKDWIVKRLENTLVAPAPLELLSPLFCLLCIADGSHALLDRTPTLMCLRITCSPSCTTPAMV